MQKTAVATSRGANPVMICVWSARVLSFALAVLTGIWHEHAMAAGEVEFAAQLTRIHVAFGSLFVASAAYTLWTGRRRLLDLFVSPDTWGVRAKQHLVTLYVALFAGVAVSAVAALAGVQGAVAFHAGAGLMLAVVVVLQAVVHAVCRKNANFEE